MQIKFKLNSKGVKHNLIDIFPDYKLSVEEVFGLVSYHSRLERWWRFYYNSNQPVQVERLCFPSSKDK